MTALRSALESLLVLWSENPGIFLAFAVVLVIVAFRLAFLSGLKVTAKELRAVELERNKEHAARQATAKTRKVQAIVEMSAWRERKGA